MKCQLNHLNLEQNSIQQKHDLNCRHLCLYYFVSTSVDIYIFFGVGKRANNKCYKILSTITFKLITTTNKYCRAFILHFFTAQVYYVGSVFCLVSSHFLPVKVWFVKSIIYFS